MSWLMTIIVGLLVGWLAGLASGSFRRFGTPSNILSGIAGAIIGYWLYVSVFSLGIDVTRIGFFSTAALLWEIGGAVAWLIVTNLIRSWEMRMEESMMERGRVPSYGMEYYTVKEETKRPKRETGRTTRGSRTTRTTRRERK